jgi:hypothetical protein
MTFSSSAASAISGLNVEPGAKWSWMTLLRSGLKGSFTNLFHSDIESEREKALGSNEGLLAHARISPFERISHGTLSWLGFGSSVLLELIKPDDTRIQLFSGLVAAPRNYADESSFGVSFKCMGTLYQADLAAQKPFFDVKQRDAGLIIAGLLNAVLNRHYAKAAVVTTGIKLFYRGSFTNNLLTSGIQEVLSQTTTADGTNMWTLACDPGSQPVIRLKDMTSIHWTVTMGGRGVSHDLENDMTMMPNVIFGEGVSPRGEYWRNSKYPYLQSWIPLYPLSPNRLFYPGSSTRGFQEFADAMRVLGYTMYSQDTYDVRDKAEVINIQTIRGIETGSSGTVGPQTWATVFDTANAKSNSLSSAYIKELAIWTKVEPWLYNAAGARVATNPKYERWRTRVERVVNYGSNIYKAEAIRSAKAEVYPSGLYEPNIVGSVTLKIDPVEGSRFQIHAGENILLKYAQPPAKNSVIFKGGAYDNYPNYDGLLLHISAASHDFMGGQTQLTVSSRPHDLQTIGQIIERNRLNASPGRIPGYNKRRSTSSYDHRPVFDVEAGAGRIPKHALYHDIWTVIRIPASHLDSIVRTEFSTSPHTTFAVGVFSKPVKAAHLKRYVGNPLTSEHPWDGNAAALDRLGLIMAWGGKGARMGYYPRQEGDQGASVTGKFVDDGQWDIDSYYPPWVWIAEFANIGTFISGRFWAAPAN